MKQKYTSGCGGGRWDVWVVLLICELLVFGVRPTAISLSIVTMYTTLYGVPPNKTPSVSFVCQCRTVIEVIGTTYVAMKIT